MMRTILIILLLTLLSFIFYSNVFCSNKIFSQKDNLVRTYPFRVLGIDMFKRGELPFWNPYILSGVPLWANMELAYPLYFFDFLLPPAPALKYNFLFHLILAGIFMYAYLRVLKIGYLGALIGAFTFVFGGYFQSTLPHTPLWVATLYIPLLFLLFELWLNTNKKRYIVFAGFALTLQLLCSIPQIVYYSLLSLGLYTLFRTIFRKDEETVLSPSLFFIGLITLGFLLSIFQLIPTYEYYLHSAKYHFQPTQDASQLGAMFPHAILFFIGVADPYASGFIGIAGLFLALVGIILWRNKINLFFAGLSVLVLLSVFEITGFYKILFHIPGFNMFNSLQRFVNIYAFGISVLAGFGANALLRIIDSDNSHLKKRIYLVLFIIAGILISAFLLNYFLKDHVITYGHKFIAKKVFAKPGHPFSLDFYYNKLENLYSALLNILGLAILPVICVFVITVLRGKNRISRFTFQASLICIIILELHGHWLRLDWKLVDPREYYRQGEAISFIKKDTSIYRAFGLDKEDRYHFDYENRQKINDLLVPNLATIHHIQDPQGMNNFTLWNYWKVLNLINKNKPPLENLYSRDPFHLLAITNPYHKLLDLMNIKYLLSYYPITEDERWELVFDKGVKIYQNKKVVSRAFITYNYEIIKNGGDLVQIVDSPDFNPQETVLLDSDIEKPIGPASPNTVEIKKYSPLEIVIDAYTERPGILVLSDSFYPGWRAKVDGHRVKILRAYSIFRAIPLSEGRHQVTFNYFPFSFLCGCVISMVTLFFIILEGIRSLIRS